VTLNPDPFQQFTAISDFVIFITASFCGAYIKRIGQLKPWKMKTWQAIFYLVAFGALLGGIAHLWQWSPFMQTILWQPIDFSLAVAIAFFVIAVLYDWLGEATARQGCLFILPLSVFIYLLTLLFPDTFIVLTLFEGVSMLFALIIYSVLTLRKTIVAGHWMVLGVAAHIAAVIFQAMSGLRVVCVFHIDHNGFMHLLTLLGVILLTVGLRRDFLSEKI